MSLNHVVDCVRLSVLDQYPPKAAEFYPGELRKVKPPYSFLADLHMAFEKTIPRQSKAEERVPERRAKGKQQSPANSSSRRVVTVVGSRRAPTLSCSVR